ncbi:MAG: tRNA uridine-5-carboxymethylaminomethyl(34) synthesis GTPase MnmE [Bdellovibrionaceae bacterium]|nr:tRNA uridine-5-carboxymethylaminomethyl(34) synthesis GTPase MnmE [Pseudobdellovibrionaceae bacterium]
MSRYVDLVDDTICAIITAPGKAGVSVHRVSGPSALKISQKISPKFPKAPESHRAYFLQLMDRNGHPIDEALVTYFSQGKSFTGDETVEISTHGGPAIANKLLAELVHFGCRPAERGEFSFRAFYNGKIDLVQAEGILGLVNSETEAARKMSLRQLKGHLSSTLHVIEETIIRVLAQLEASIDFSTEDIEPFSLQQIQELIEKGVSLVTPLVESFQRGRVISEGLRVVICGPPNAGKSSLYNAILGTDRAIVSATPGTTRDFIETTYRDFGLPIKIVDTAGLRETQDEIEEQGIQRSVRQIEDADLALIILDGSDYANKVVRLPTPLPNQTILVFNKMDLVSNGEQFKEQVRDYPKTMLDIQQDTPIFFCSIKKDEGIKQITKKLEELCLVDVDQNESLITQYRQADHLEKALLGLKKAHQLITQTTSYDLIAIDMQESLHAIYAVLGKEFDDQVLDRVFKEFCIGK